MDPGVIVATAGTLVGVGLGSWLSGRSQREAARESQREADVERREAAYVEFMAAYRVFRRFVIAGTTSVTLSLQDGVKPYPVIEGSEAYWERVEAARARLDLLAGDTPLSKAGRDLADAFYDVARARAEHPAGAVPRPIVRAVRAAEREFARIAREDLAGRRMPGSR